MPKVTRSFIRKNSDAIPYVILTTPDLEESFGGYTHKHLKSGDYSAIFREAKKKIREAKKIGRLDYTEEPDSEEATETLPDNQTVEILNPTTEQWSASSGTTIQAKLLKVENGRDYVFETPQGKIIKVTLDQLSKSSSEKAKALIEANQ